MRYSFIVLLLLYCGFIDSKIVPKTIAQAMAEKVWAGKMTRSSSNDLHYLWNNNILPNKFQTRSSDEPLFYVFAGENNRGFVIVSAEDQVMPVLAYSLTEKAPNPEDLPEPLIDWMDLICNQIEYVRINNINNQSANRLWANTSMGNSVIELETAKWNQRKPYNNHCPMDGSERSIVGCVPVATAIVMKYHKWPQYGKGYTEPYTTETNGIFVPARDLNHEYYWDNMPNTYTNIFNYNEYTDEEAEAVSVLMADIGAAFKADYTSSSTSSAISLKVLYENFDYNPAMSYIYRKNYSEEKWIEQLKNELLSFRPVLYSGRHDNTGHQFVLDGFTDDDYFHINWGWGGSSNGYYTLSNLVPDDRGGYNENQLAYINVKPNTSSEIEDWIRFLSPGIELTQSEFETNKRYYFNKLYLKNFTAADFSGKFCGAITNRDGEFKEWITNELSYSLKSYYSVGWPNISFLIHDKINIGDRIRFFYKSNDSDEWHLIKSSGEENCQWEVLVADEFYISECTSFSFDKRNRIITLETKDGVDVSLFTPSNKKITTGLTKTGRIINIDTKQLSSGVYKIILMKGEDVKELNFSVKSL